MSPLMSRRLLALVVLAYAAAAFYPFGFRGSGLVRKNHAERTPGGGVLFLAPGIATTAEPPAWVAAAIRTDAFDLELEVVPAESGQEGPARIFTVSLDHDSRNLTVGQDRDMLAVRLRTPATSSNGTPTLRIPEMLAAGQLRKIVLSVRDRRLRVRVDGTLVLEKELPPRPLSGWEPSFRLALGNEHTFQRPWLGEIRRALFRVDGEETDCLVEPLEIRRHHVVPFHWIHLDLWPFMGELHRSPLDWIVNLLGFVPLGYFLARGSRRSVPVLLLLAGGASFFIEAAQLLLPDRFTSLADVAMNSVGAALGIAIARWGARTAASRPADNL